MALAGAAEALIAEPVEGFLPLSLAAVALEALLEALGEWAVGALVEAAASAFLALPPKARFLTWPDLLGAVLPSALFLEGEEVSAKLSAELAFCSATLSKLDTTATAACLLTLLMGLLSGGLDVAVGGSTAARARVGIEVAEVGMLNRCLAL